MINIAPYWARAREGDFYGWGWSFTSEDEARANAAKKAAQNAEWFTLGTLGEHSDWYYADRPMREPILRELADKDGGILAVVTRNSYGCLVLNTASACFVDVDFPPIRKARPRFVSWLLRETPPAAITEQTQEAEVIALARHWVAENPEWGWRIYRTKAGVRLLATHATMVPDSPEVANVCQALGADRLYQRLCKSQRCFRARLTPKSWRCGLSTSKVIWPCESEKEILEMQAWIEQYEPLCYTHATCRFVTHLGASEVLPELQPLIALHDETTLAHAALPLA